MWNKRYVSFVVVSAIVRYIIGFDNDLLKVEGGVLACDCVSQKWIDGENCHRWFLT